MHVTRRNVLDFSIYIVLFLLLLSPYTDPDFGWHYKYGEYFFQNHSLLMHDVYSWTMPGYAWVNHSWGFDLLLYVIFHSFGFLGLSVAGACIGVCVFYLLTRNYNLTIRQKVIAGVIYSQFTWNIFWQGMRSQTVSFFMLALTVYVLTFFEKKPRAVFFLPIIFLLWVNLHGSFTLGLFTLLLFLLSELAVLVREQKRKLSHVFVPKSLFMLAAAFILSVAATCINPFGYRVYTEVFKYINNPLMNAVEEWKGIPIISFTFLVFFLYCGFLIYGFLKRKDAHNFSYLALALGGAILTIRSLRFMGFFMVLSMPMLFLSLKEFSKSLKNNKIASFGFYVLLSIVAIDLFLELPPKVRLISYSYEEYCAVSTNCSEKLIQMLLKNPPKGRGLNVYKAGGYLVGRGVTSKIFIDGQMDVWQDAGGYSPFRDYIDMYFFGDSKKFRKYNFNWLIIEPNSYLGRSINKVPELGSWRQIYRDNNLVYFVKIR